MGARRALRARLREMALERGVDLVLLAHHRRDQAETFLLQALRGGGGAGARGDAEQRVHRDGMTWARPWLEQPREAIEAYARRHRLRWIDDDSNDDDRFARNRLRLRVWPALVAAFGDAEVRSPLRPGAPQDAAARRSTRSPRAISPRSPMRAGSTSRAGGCFAARRREALLGWLRSELGGGPPASLVERLVREATRRAQRRWPVGGRRAAQLSRPAAPVAALASLPSAVEPLGRRSAAAPGVHEIAGVERGVSRRARRTRRHRGRDAASARAPRRVLRAIASRPAARVRRAA